MATLERIEVQARIYANEIGVKLAADTNSTVDKDDVLMLLIRMKEIFEKEIHPSPNITSFKPR